MFTNLRKMAMQAMLASTTLSTAAKFFRDSRSGAAGVTTDPTVSARSSSTCSINPGTAPVSGPGDTARDWLNLHRFEQLDQSRLPEYD